MSNEGSGSVAGSSGAAPSSPSPASTPAGGDGGSGDSGYNFMGEVFGDTATPSPASPAESPGAEPSSTPEVLPVTPAPATPAVVPAAPEAPQPATATPPASGQQGSPATAPEAQKFDPADPISLARGLDDNREAAIEHLAQTVFKLEPKELEALEADVAGEVPKLLAKAVVFAQTQFLTQLSRVVPLMIQRHGAVTKRNDENMSEFYSAWPGLDRSKHGAVVQELAVRFRQMFPTVTKEQMIEQLGPMVLASQGLPVTAMNRGQAAPKQNGGQPRPQNPKAAGFIPAAPGTVAQTTLVPEDPWSFMGPETG